MIIGNDYICNDHEDYESNDDDNVWYRRSLMVSLINKDNHNVVYCVDKDYDADVFDADSENYNDEIFLIRILKNTKLMMMLMMSLMIYL